MRLWGGGDAAQVQARLAAGADPCAPSGSGGWTMLHVAAELASPEVVAAMAGAARELDGLAEGRSALWLAVHSGRYENAHVLAAAGADPWLPMMAGWSPGRLSLAGPEPELFPSRPAGVWLTPVEAEAAALGRELKTTLTGFHFDGTGLLCVADVDAAEAVRRLDGTPMSEEELLAPWSAGPYPRGPSPTGVYANPKSGNQGSIFTDGTITGWDLHPGGSPWKDATSDEVLLSYLYRSNAAAYACGYVGLCPPNARPVTGPPDAWVLLPDRDYWHDSVRS